MTFTTQNLAGNRTLVRGEDINGGVGETVLNNTQYKELALRNEHAKAHSEFDAQVEAFYAPLTEAADAFNARGVAVMTDPDEDLFLEVVVEAVEATPGTPEVHVHLLKDTVILRLIDAGQDARLVWVGGDLEILATDAVPAFIPGTDTFGFDGADGNPVNTDEPTA